MPFQSVLAQQYPKAIREKDFVARTYQSLLRFGFGQHNTLACVASCRDEISRPLGDEISKTWGQPFDASSLAGMLFLGKTGFRAAEHHAPIHQGRERYVFYAMPHIAIGREGEPGVCLRPGRDVSSGACGALIAFLQETKDSKILLDSDPEDMEYSLMKQRLSLKIKPGQALDLFSLTQLAYEAILEDLGRMLALTVNTAHSDFAVLSGIQVHGPDRCNYTWPGVLYALVSGKRQRIDI